mmetsp:Transcript_12441/g.30575  ORF Transcript_12441/g.30575 Transcript_12441/m.30575 type:complete len:278 (+) Transcript_12441:329-1162(+)
MPVAPSSRLQHAVLVGDQELAHQAAVRRHVGHAVHGCGAPLHTVRVGQQLRHARAHVGQQRLHHVPAARHVRRGEAKVQGWRRLQRVEVPALPGEQVVQLVDVEGGAGPRAKRHQAHVRLAQHGELGGGVDARDELVGGGHEVARDGHVALDALRHERAPRGGDERARPAACHGGRDVQPAAPVRDGRVLVLPQRRLRVQHHAGPLVRQPKLVRVHRHGVHALERKVKGRHRPAQRAHPGQHKAAQARVHVHPAPVCPAHPRNANDVIHNPVREPGR